MAEPLRLNEIFPDWITGSGIFAALQDFNIPWKLENISLDLDIEYHGNRSGAKIISPLAQQISHGEPLTALQKVKLASAIYAIYNKNWVKQWATLSLTYNPIENYSMTEIMSNDETINAYGKNSTRTDNLTHSKSGYDSTDIDFTDTRTDNLDHTKTGTDTLTPNTTETTTPNLTASNTNTVYGFNSSNPVNASGQSQTSSGTSTVTHTGTEQTSYNTSETNTGTQTNVKDETQQITYNSQDADTGTQSVQEGGRDVHTRNYQLERSGNIGVTTSQQMINSERALWIWNFFQDIVFPDIDKFLTIQVY